MDLYFIRTFESYDSSIAIEKSRTDQNIVNFYKMLIFVLKKETGIPISHFFSLMKFALQ